MYFTIQSDCTMRDYLNHLSSHFFSKRYKLTEFKPNRDTFSPLVIISPERKVLGMYSTIQICYDVCLLFFCILYESDSAHVILQPSSLPGIGQARFSMRYISPADILSVIVFVAILQHHACWRNSRALRARFGESTTVRLLH